MAVLCQAFGWVQAMSATSSCDQETDKASRDESISGHARCGLDGRVDDFGFASLRRGRAAPEAMIARLDSTQNLSQFNSGQLRLVKLLDARIIWGDASTASHTTGIGIMTTYFRRTKLFASD